VKEEFTWMVFWKNQYWWHFRFTRSSNPL